MDALKKMPEAEVSLRLAFYLIERRLAASDVSVVIDGAQIKTTNTIHFGISEFLRGLSWLKSSADEIWQGTYIHRQHKPNLIIHPRSGGGDVVTTLIDGRTFRAECKKGPLVGSKSSQELPLLREAMGQVLTMNGVTDRDLLAVAVPRSPKFEELAQRWRIAPLVARSGIHILTVGRDGQVSGLPELVALNQSLQQTTGV